LFGEETFLLAGSVLLMTIYYVSLVREIVIFICVVHNDILISECLIFYPLRRDNFAMLQVNNAAFIYSSCLLYLLLSNYILCNLVLSVVSTSFQTLCCGRNSTNLNLNFQT